MKQVIKTIFLLLALLSTSNLYAGLHGQALVDSMLREITLKKDDTNKVNLLNGLSLVYSSFNPDEGMLYGKQGVELSTRLQWNKGLAGAYISLGNDYQNKSDYAKAKGYYLSALKIYEAAGGKFAEEKIFVLNSIITVSSYQNNYGEAVRYYSRLLQIPQKHDKLNFYTGALLGILIFAFFYNLFLFRSVGDRSIKNAIYSISWFFVIYSVAIAHPTNRIELYLFDCFAFGFAIFFLSKLFMKFIHYFLVENGISVFRERQIANNKKILNIIFSLLLLSAFVVYCLRIRYEDDVAFSRMFIVACDVVILAQMAYTLANFMGSGLYKIKAFRFVALMQIILLGGVFLSVVLTFAFHIHNTLTELSFATCIILQSISIADKINFLKLQKEQAQENALALLEDKVAERTSELMLQKRRSDDLLLNILPAEVAEELKETGSASAKLFDNVTVLFTDFINFTKASERMLPQGLIDELDTCFKAFDEITTRFKIEKIKTIGDAYLAVGGLPSPDPEHAEHIVSAAIEIINFMRERATRLGNETFEIRIGIHTGSVVAGIVGVKKFAYDIWGDTVNTAARMEQNSDAGKINISQTTYVLVKHKFICEYRGEIEAKGKGMMKMYYVK